ncbi:hypothetical protein NC653_025798 [Populus alba x Populus x berolinensis]|uniref:Uncharacterized protein n=1 Tax=Populus alba x Populus x berolinensis TaxID=444605 RepID=A0AAD6MC43_9ROSI|nr:hypothetical protein NC653_025798 [Populus alba x Populus x berolinensis]
MRLQCKIKLGRPLHVEFSASLLTSTFLVQVFMDDINAGNERLAELQGPQRCWFGHEEQSRHAKMLKCRAAGPVSVRT